MAAALLVVFAHLWIISLCKEPQTAKPGQDVPLPCQYDKNRVIELLEWSRAELKSDKFVLYYRENLFPNYQLPSYLGRVVLRDPEMKNGNASVILKNVNINDTGTYQCRIGGSSTGRTKRNTPEVMNTIKLEVTDSGHTAGGDGGVFHGRLGLLVSVGLVACVVIVVGFLGFMRKNSKQPLSVEAGEQDPLEKSNSKKDECHLNITPNEI